MGYMKNRTGHRALGWNLCFSIGIFIVFAPHFAFSAEIPLVQALSMTLTPPLYQISLAPGATWSSNLQFRNGNSYPLTVHLSVENFRAGRDSGIELFPKTNASSSPYELALWVTQPKTVLVVQPGVTENIPFHISIPKDAEPGGHYAAMVVSTAPDASDSMLSVSSGVSSLLLVRVAGDVLEEGSILDFSSEHFVAQSQEATFHLRFENTGNVHIEPSGDIDIENMFGKTRGRVTMNSSHAFGNILPHSTKVFSFEWKGEKNFFDIGLYHARARLVYGENKEKTAYYSTYFLVFPWLPVVSISAFLFVFLRFVRRSVRRYVASAVRIEQKKHGNISAVAQKGSIQVANPKMTFAILRQPISGPTRAKNRQAFFLFLLIALLGMMLIADYFYQVFQTERQYQVTMSKDSRVPF
jgi:hypothetical protein